MLPPFFAFLLPSDPNQWTFPELPIIEYNQNIIEQRKQGCFMVSKVPANLPITLVKATRAESDEALLKSWLRSLNSPHTQRNFEVTARRFLAELPEGGLRAATVEDVRDALTSMSAGLSEASARQYVLRIKSLLGYAHALGYTPFNAGATIKVRSDAGNRGANLAKRIMSEVEVGLLIRAAPSKRDRVLLEVIYAGGLRVSETVALTWADVLPRDDRVQLSILARAARCARCSCPRSSAGRSCPCAAMPAPTIPCSPAARAAAPHRARRQRHGQARGSQGRHQRGDLAALAAPRPRLACHRPRRLAARGAGHARPRQHRHHVRLPARPARHLERPAPRSWGVSSMRSRISV